MDICTQEQHLNVRIDRVDADPRPRSVVIEDNETLRILLSRLLAAIGFDVCSAGSTDGLRTLVDQRIIEAGAAEAATQRLNMRHGTALVMLGVSDLSGRGYATERVMRNLERHLRTLAPPGSEVVEERWTYDSARWTLIAPAGFRAQLSLAESQVVRSLLMRSGIVTTRDEMLSALNRPHNEAERRNLDVTISRLRKKIEMLCRCKLPLSSVRGRGYLFSAPAAVIG